MVLATNMYTGQDVGAFTDGYKNLKLVKDPDTQTMKFSGEKVEISGMRRYVASPGSWQNSNKF